MKKKCFICNEEVSKNNSFSFKCLNCNFYFSNLKPSFGQDVRGIEAIRRKNFRKLIKIITDLKHNPQILEIGSGDGFFIEECINFNVSITGSEASIDALKILKKKFNKKFHLLNLSLPESIKKKTKERFDFVIFNDVFEHLENLDDVISDVKNILKKDGVVIINLPSSNGVIFKISEFLMKLGFNKFYNRLWQKNMSSPHLSYFNEKNLKQLFSKHNMEKVISGFLDSLSFNNYERFKNLYRNSIIAIFFTIICFIFSIIQRFLPKDIIFIFFKKVNSKK